MSSSNCCFLTCIHISQEADKVVWYSHLLKNVPQFVVTDTVKDVIVVSEAEVDFLGGMPWFFCDPVDVGSLISSPPAFINPACTSGSFQFMYCRSLAWRIFEPNLTSMWNECSCAAVSAQFFGIALLWDWNENRSFPILWPLLSFPNLIR